MSTNKSKFFITHSFRDSDFGQRLTDDLRKQGLEGFHDFYSFRPSENLMEQVSPGLEESDVYLPVLSSAAVQSPWFKEEIGAAIALGNLPGRNGRPRIIPVLTEDLNELPELVRPMRCINFTGNYDQALRELLTKGLGMEPATVEPERTAQANVLTAEAQPGAQPVVAGTGYEKQAQSAVPKPTAQAAEKSGKMYCTNHPQTETYLRCNKCGRPMCVKCAELTPVGYRCKECLGVQRQGYYNASTFDYVIAAIVGLVLSVIGGVIMSLIGGGLGFFGILIGLFGGPIGGGIVAEGIRAAVQRHRGRYLWLVACGALIIGGFIGLVGLSLLPLLFALLGGQVGLLARFSGALLLNLGFWVYLALAVSTAYARLRV